MTPQAHQIYEILVGFGVAGTGFGVILAVVGRASSEKNRSQTNNAREDFRRLNMDSLPPKCREINDELRDIQ